MKTLCYSVRLLSLTSISEKAYKAVAFDGSEAILPKSQVFGIDTDVSKSDGWWISAWILEQKTLQYSRKKSALFNRETGAMLPRVEYMTHTPKRIGNTKTSPDESLTR